MSHKSSIKNDIKYITYFCECYYLFLTVVDGKEWNLSVEMFNSVSEYFRVEELHTYNNLKLVKFSTWTF